jgi:hypothetical protein
MFTASLAGFQRVSLALLLTLGCAAAADAARPFGEVFGPNIKPSSEVQPLPERPSRSHDAAEALLRWNRIAVDASGLDHTPVAPGENRKFGEQLGPGRASRAMAMVHIAMFDAVNAIIPRYKPYSRLKTPPVLTSMQAAIAQAAHDSLVAEYPSQRARFDDFLEEDLSGIPDSRAKANGISLGQQSAAVMVAHRVDDGWSDTDPKMGTEYIPGNAAGVWRQDPIGKGGIALGATWGKVTPFVLLSGKQFRAPPPPKMTSVKYTKAYREVQLFGGDGIVTPTQRTADQTEAGIFWAYDGTPSLCAPPRLYNQLALVIAEQMGTTTRVVEMARLLALINTAMADSGIAIWESKFFYNFWRPVTGIRESDEGTGPSLTGDGNPDTVGDPTFTPLGAPASNLQGPNFTPPFPSYPSGHAGFGGALFQTLRKFYGTDDIAFTFVSDEFNGVTRDNQGNVRPLLPRTFSSLSEAEEENGQSRVYLGIHWSFDKSDGIAQGRKVADYVFANAFVPLRR